MSEPSLDDAEIDFAANHNSYINVTDIPNLTELTICAWIKTNDTSKVGTLFFYTTQEKGMAKQVVAMALTDFRGNRTIDVGTSKR